MSEPILRVNAIHTYIGQFHILEGVDFAIQPDSITAILGRIGAGQTTTLRSIMGLANVRQGNIQFEGRDITRMRPFKTAKLGIGYVPEHRAIFRDLSVQENLIIAERDKGDFERHAEMIFALFPDLKRLFKMGGGSLSGGQQQMLAVARALVPDNKLLLIDEPSEGLAPVIIEAMMAAIRQLSEHTTVVLGEQNFRRASQLAQEYIIIEEGRSVAMGRMADLAADEALIHRYLGAA